MATKKKTTKSTAAKTAAKGGAKRGAGIYEACRRRLCFRELICSAILLVGTLCFAVVSGNLFSISAELKADHEDYYAICDDGPTADEISAREAAEALEAAVEAGELDAEALAETAEGDAEADLDEVSEFVASSDEEKSLAVICRQTAEISYKTDLNYYVTLAMVSGFLMIVCGAALCVYFITALASIEE